MPIENKDCDINQVIEKFKQRFNNNFSDLKKSSQGLIRLLCMSKDPSHKLMLTYLVQNMDSVEHLETTLSKMFHTKFLSDQFNSSQIIEMFKQENTHWFSKFAKDGNLPDLITYLKKHFEGHLNYPIPRRKPTESSKETDLLNKYSK